METKWDHGNCAGASVSAVPGACDAGQEEREPFGTASAAASSPASPPRQTERSTARLLNTAPARLLKSSHISKGLGRTPAAIAPSTFLFLNPRAWICCYQLVILVAKPETWWKDGRFRSRGGISLKIWSLKIVFCYPSETWWLRNRLLWKNVNFLWYVHTTCTQWLWIQHRQGNQMK